MAKKEKADKAVKTNVLRHLNAEGIAYETRDYSVEDENFDGKLVAAKVGLPAEMIFKTLVLTDDAHGHLVCPLPEIEPHHHDETCYENDMMRSSPRRTRAAIC